MKVFFLYTFTLSLFLLFVLSFIFVFKNPGTSLIFSRIFPILECSLLGFFFYLNFIAKWKKIFFSVGTILLVLSFLIDLFTNKEEPSFFPLAMECLYFILVILYYFYERMKVVNEIPIFSIPCFWISVAFLISFSGTFFLYLFSITMVKDPAFKNTYHLIYGSFTIIKNLLLCTGIIINSYYLTNEQQKKKLPTDIDLGSFNPLTNKPNF